MGELFGLVHSRTHEIIGNVNKNISDICQQFYEKKKSAEPFYQLLSPYQFSPSAAGIRLPQRARLCPNARPLRRHKCLTRIVDGTGRGRGAGPVAGSL